MQWKFLQNCLKRTRIVWSALLLPSTPTTPRVPVQNNVVNWAERPSLVSDCTSRENGRRAKAFVSRGRHPSSPLTPPRHSIAALDPKPSSADDVRNLTVIVVTFWARVKIRSFWSEKPAVPIIRHSRPTGSSSEVSNPVGVRQKSTLENADGSRIFSDPAAVRQSPG